MDYQLLVDHGPEMEGMLSQSIPHYSNLFKPENIGNALPESIPIRPASRFGSIYDWPGQIHPNYRHHQNSTGLGGVGGRSMNAQGTNSIGNKNIGLPRVGIKRESEEVEDNYQEDEDISHDRQLIVKLMISGSTQREAARKLRISLNKLKACCKAMQINIWPGKLIRLTEEVGKFLRQLRASGDHLFDDKAKKMLNIIDEVDYAKLRCKASAGSYRRVLSALEKASMAKKTLELMRDRRNKRNHLERKVFKSLAMGHTYRSGKAEDLPIITAMWSKDDIDFY